MKTRLTFTYRIQLEFYLRTCLRTTRHVRTCAWRLRGAPAGGAHHPPKISDDLAVLFLVLPMPLQRVQAERDRLERARRGTGLRTPWRRTHAPY